ncbi:outer membrane protein assembly factor BamA [Carnimonas nigrificans]|uniref:outer membrane protein assembly factor BamA n=1 Tax=Carnimonas nigrificans TaxID=64323 RepID=UPI0004B6C520|nr:outer membrane protein assembly factor BamA [Carnimonas nigrificans]
MKIKTLGLAAMLLGSSQLVHAASFQISHIRVEGLQRVSSGTVFNVLPLNGNRQLDESQLSQAGKALYGTGLFDDISFERQGEDLIVHLKERPSVARININGNKQISTDNLKKGLADAGILEGQVLQRSTLEEVQRSLENVYQDQGRYNATIKTAVVPLDANRVQVNINVNEGGNARIRQINFVGNHAFSDDQLLDELDLADHPGWFLGWFSHDKFSSDAMSKDLDNLRAFYQDRGYVNFNVTSSQVSLSPDKADIYININMDEGEQYRISNINFAGQLGGLSEEQVRGLVQAKEGDVYNQSKLTASADAIRDALGNEGYTFAKVDAVPNTSDSNDTAEVTFNIDPGKRAYVRRINFSGNTTTADEVLRREMTQMEGAPASSASIKDSQARLQRLGFFSDVKVDTHPVEGHPDELDVDYTVTEQPSGSISASLGFAQSEGLIYGASLSQSNFLGTGNRVDIGATKSNYFTNLNFSYTDPYWTLSGISRGFNLYYRKSDYDDSDIDISSYSSDAVGGGVNFGYPISDLSRLNFGIGGEHLTLDTYHDTPWEIYQYVKDEGDTFDSYKLSVSWTRNNLNRGIMPTDGSYQRLSLEGNGPGSDAQIYKLRYRGDKLFELNPEWALKFSTNLGYANKYGKTDVYPFYENFYSGGLGSVRGFRTNSLGQRTTPRGGDDDDYTLGGNIQMEGSADLIFPTPFIEDHRQVQTSLFVDAGNTYLSHCYSTGDGPKSDCESGVDLGDMNLSAGVGLSWLTPVGPLTFSVAKPIHKASGAESQFFQFSLGQTF